MLNTFNSKAPTAIPAAAPEPARPMKCSLPMLLANNEAPICKFKYRFNAIVVLFGQKLTYLLHICYVFV